MEKLDATNRENEVHVTLVRRGSRNPAMRKGLSGAVGFAPQRAILSEVASSDVKASAYSIRSARVGSIRDALHAGTVAATNPTSISTSPTVPKLRGSRTFIPAGNTSLNG
jgi:hypothetical protein